MCPTGWFIETTDAPDYLTSTPRARARARRAQGCRASDVDRRRRVPLERRRPAPRAAAGPVSRPSRSSPSRTSGVSVTTSRTATDELERRRARGVGARRGDARARSPEGHRRARARVCAGCRRSAPGSTISTARSSRTRCVITNAAGVAAAPIAEFAIGRLLAVWKRFDEIDEQQRAHDWKPSFGTLVEGLTLGDHRSGRDRHRGRGPRPRLRHDDHRHPPELPARVRSTRRSTSSAAPPICTTCSPAATRWSSSAPGTAGDREPLRRGRVRGDEARCAVLQRRPRVARRRSRR